MDDKLSGFARTRWLAIAIAILLASSGAQAQKKKKKQPDANTPMPALELPVSEQIDHDIGEMLGAFQVGNVEAMHKYYADNATFVSSTYQPPVVGWQNYAADYQRERAAFPGMQLIRKNTSIFHSGDVAWACYQWEFDSTYNGKPYTARGQTTLVLVKQAGNWLIVHNHTSEICPQAAQGPTPGRGAPQTPAKNAPAAPPKS
ncbi:MAG: YybH family protein [Candidatus Acidiferrales bacterium]